MTRFPEMESIMVAWQARLVLQVSYLESVLALTCTEPGGFIGFVLFLCQEALA